ncbi:unnamed protein product [Adineta steineri]|uniref:Uncharacterized protein n=1 Tax=Adineta steineri TaxID=433720 RepID=A0A814V9A9_9BILA|nr:unnamed protein product [Adineta steineri]CAF1185918.1 unnamed protein product [Adineta steineri]
MYHLEQGESYLPDKQTTLEDRYYNNQGFQEEYPVNDPEVNNAATKIQAKFRGHKARQDVEKMKQNKDVIDTDQQELGYDRGQSGTPKEDEHQSFHHDNQKSPHTPTPHAEQHTPEHKATPVEEDQQFDAELTEEEKQEQDRAARSIQARFRGHKGRQQSGNQGHASPGSATSEREQLSDRPEHHDSHNDKTSHHQSEKHDNEHGHDTKHTHQTETGEHNDTDRPRLEREPTQLSEDFERHTQVPRDSDFDREQRSNLNEEDDDIDMSDPNLEKAATRIQASFRGYKTRKELVTGGTNDQHPTSTSSHGHDEYDNSHNKILSSSVEGNKEPEGEEDDSAAAVKIQAAYRGYRVRKDMEK